MSEVATETASFAGLGVPDHLVAALNKQRITEPFEIQTLTIPDALAGRDILGRAPTGSGKTLAFGLPTMARLGRGGKKKPRGLILSPTRELAEQISRELEPLAKAAERNTLAVYGGKGITPQVKALRQGVDLLIACPGRLLDLINQGAVRLDGVDIVVVDEADRMADMGFLPDVRRLLNQTSPDRQTVLFSATLDKEVQVLIDTYQTDPIQHQVAEAEPDLSVMTHRFIEVPRSDRLAYAADIIDDTGPTVVFVRTRHGVDRLARQLKAQGVSAGNLHGGRSQSQRDRALQVFTDGKVQALVATDVAARGIHVDGVACVLHYDPPADIKDYVHRSGRTARAGAAGMVVSFLDPSQVGEARKMQRKLGIESDLEDPVVSPGRALRLESKPAAHARTNNKPGGKSNQKSKPHSKSKSHSKSKPHSKSTSKPKPSSDSKSENRSDNRSENRPGSKPRSESGSDGTGRPSRGKAKPGGKNRAGSKQRAGDGGEGKKGGGRPTSKRSGKPRPKNRKKGGASSSAKRSRP